mmetsp:Transcript_9055/g.13695  ORF Transcript_9055/g.13695 Transcript_9055/m.13695 type:complete len:882 (+) Transcript_9055:85-2730(+)|eukprot:CAMPEP_0201551570 /NCGR_PEP_ID=MMETSP0173_2-20130828/7726_1 /ASSEMBLY_ACC=CAM_ASM_000268 /TAXON_ID=218659 /ORGANISM="Vexillifera sp., Strain DIVA3 564/2" /LENGTH=881 /DNA_ID=CAMNT_0047961861 /DNA_START=35 /DNA_END=2680 /DNA_ORIENTATION=+
MSKSKAGKYFSTTKRGEINELRQELESGKEERQKAAVKKIIAAMTVGKDVSILFPNVVKSIHTNDVELKKLVYLYIMNYAKSKPDLAILAVNTFVKDAESPSPLIRALAVRTMGCIRVSRITEYLCQPLHKCLKDTDPYVRKTAAVCVAKLYDISPDLVETQGFLDSLLDLLADSNPMVVANAVAALSEIEESSPTPVFKINSANLSKLLAALNECTEWGQVFILNSLASYDPRNSREAENICERVTPRLQHANSAVVLGAIKVIIKYMESIQSKDVLRSLTKKMAPPLVTLLSKEPEIQYVALRNINLIVQKRPAILQYEMKVFFCKYNDPIYVKMEKLELMIMLASEKNIDQVLLELKEYATEADVEFVRKSVRAIGRCAIKLDRAADRCVDVLLELIKTKVSYVVQEGIIVMKDIFRKYPDKYESIIEILCEALDDSIDEPEAKAAMIWIIGEYAERIDNADELLELFLDNFHDEPVEVQLQMLTATVKLFLKKPKQNKDLVQDALKMATEESDNPDLRDRGFVYWRLLSTDPKAAKSVILAQKPLISDDTLQLEESLLDDLLSNISTLASVYHKPPETFVSKLRRLHKVKKIRSSSAASSSNATSSNAASTSTDAAQQQQQPSLLDLSSDSAPTTTTPGKNVSKMRGLLAAQAGKGMQIVGCWSRTKGNVFFNLTIENQSQGPLANFELQFNANSLTITPANTGPLPIGEIAPGTTSTYALPVKFGGPAPAQGTPFSNEIKMAIRNNTGEIYFFADIVPINVLFTENGRLEKKPYLQRWQTIPSNQEHIKEIPQVAQSALTSIQATLGQYNVFFVAKTKNNGKFVLYFSALLAPANTPVLIELTFSPNATCQSCIKTENPLIAPMWDQFITSVLQKE